MKQVQIRQSGATASWSNLDNTYGSAWETGNAPGYPWDFNIISADDESVSRPPPHYHLWCCPCRCYLNCIAMVHGALLLSRGPLTAMPAPMPLMCRRVTLAIPPGQLLILPM